VREMVDSATAGQGVKRTVHQPITRAERLPGFALVLLPGLAWLVMAIYAWATCPPPSNTGDPLLDKLAVALTNRLLGSKQTGWLEPALPNEVFSAWESEYADDPRFWMLRYHLTNEAQPAYRIEADGLSLKEPESEYGAPKQTISSIEFLKAARRRKVADSAVLLRLLRYYESVWWHNARPHVDAMSIDWDSYDKSYAQMARTVIDEMYGAEQQTLLDELFTVSLDQALPYYYAGLYETQRGNHAQALDCIAAGNRVASCSALTGFPYDELFTNARNGSFLIDKTVDGAMWLSYEGAPISDWLQLRNDFERAAESAVENEDLKALDNLHEFYCRLGLAEDADIIQVLFTRGQVGSLSKDVLNNWPGTLTESQKAALSELEVKCNQITFAVSQYLGSSGQSLINMPKWQRALWTVEGRLTGSRSTTVWMFEDWYEDRLAEQKVLTGPIKQVIAELARFDYTTLSWEE